MSRRDLETSWVFPRGQYDRLGDQYSDLTATRRPDGEAVLVRPELAAECDINLLLRRGNVTPPQSFPVGEFDESLDLQAVFAHAQAYRDSWAAMPDAVRRNFRSWEHLAEEVAAGRVVYDKPPAASAGGSADAGGGSTSP